MPKPLRRSQGPPPPESVFPRKPLVTFDNIPLVLLIQPSRVASEDHARAFLTDDEFAELGFARDLDEWSDVFRLGRLIKSRWSEARGGYEDIDRYATAYGEWLEENGTRVDDNTFIPAESERFGVT